MLAAFAASMAEKGYVATSVADIIKGAGVSRETFYQQFSSKGDAFVAGFADQRKRLIRVVAAAVPEKGDRFERFGAAMTAYLNALADEPAVARLYLIEVYAAGPEVMTTRAEMQQAFVDGMAAVLKLRSKRDRFACEALVAAIVSLVTARFAADDVEGVRALQKPLVDLAERLFG